MARVPEVDLKRAGGRGRGRGVWVGFVLVAGLGCGRASDDDAIDAPAQGGNASTAGGTSGSGSGGHDAVSGAGGSLADAGASVAIAGAMQVAGSAGEAMPAAGAALPKTPAVPQADLAAADFFPPTTPKKGVRALDDADLFNILCIPPYTPGGDLDASVIDAVAAYCEQRRAMFVFDAPTVAGRAVRVEQALGAAGVLHTPGITVVSRTQ